MARWLLEAGDLGLALEPQEQISDRAAQHGAVYLHSFPFIPDGVCPVSVETIWGSLVGFFCCFFFKPATFYRISHLVLYCKSRNETSERMWDLYIPTSIQKKKKVKADFRSSEVRWSEGLWSISWKHCSACLIEALFPISLCTWGIERAFPTVHCEAQLQADETLRVYTCLLHPVWPPLLSLPLSFPLSLGQYEFALRPKPTGWTCLLLNVPHKHTTAFTCTHQPFYQVCASLASVLCYISSTSPQVAVILVNSPLYR